MNRASAASSPVGANNENGWATESVEMAKERLLVTHITKSHRRILDVNDSIGTTYALVKLPASNMGMSLVNKTMFGGDERTIEYDFKSSTGPNDFYLFDSIYIVSKKMFVFKYGDANGSTTQYKIMTYHEGDKSASNLVNWGRLRNRTLLVSPDSKFVAYIKGGSYDGPDKSYFADPLELWTCTLDKGVKRQVAIDDDLTDSFLWKNDHDLLYLVHGRGHSHEVRTLIGLNVATGVRKIIVEHAALTKTRGDFGFQSRLRLLAAANDFRAGDYAMATPDHYKEGSLAWDPPTKTLTYLIDCTPQAVLDHANKTRDWQINVRLRAMRCGPTVGKPNDGVCGALGEIDVPTYEMDVTATPIVGRSSGAMYIVRSLSKDWIAVWPPPSATSPKRIYTCVAFDGKATAVQWRVEDVMGLSVCDLDGSHSVLVNY